MPPLVAETLLELLPLQLLNYMLSTCCQRSRAFMGYWYRPEAHPEDVELPRMFSGEPSDLRKFSYICWPHNAFQNLTHLSLHEQLTTPTLGEFLNMLEDSESPCLEVQVERTGPEIPQWTSILPKQRVALPSTYPAYTEYAFLSTTRNLWIFITGFWSASCPISLKSSSPSRSLSHSSN